jgi:hypothetical protein
VATLMSYAYLNKFPFNQLLISSLRMFTKYQEKIKVEMICKRMKYGTLVARL